MIFKNFQDIQDLTRKGKHEMNSSEFYKFLICSLKGSKDTSLEILNSKNLTEEDVNFLSLKINWNIPNGFGVDLKGVFELDLENTFLQPVHRQIGPFHQV